MTEIILGCKVRDRVSGFEGIVTSRHVFVDGSLHFGVQPRITKEKAETHPDATTFDANQLEFIAGIDAGLKPAPYNDNVKVTLGEMLQDEVTGYQGIAMIRTDFLNGCVYFSLPGKPLKKGEKPPKTERFEHFSLKKVGVGISKKVPKQPKASEIKPPARAGGPSMKVERQ